MTYRDQKRQNRDALGTLLAAGACGGAAVATSAAAAGHTWQVWAPLVFSAVLLLIALSCGMRAGILGTLLATVGFAVFLYGPAGSLHVANGARSNLGWMLLMGIAFSFLFAPPTSGFPRR